MERWAVEVRTPGDARSRWSRVFTGEVDDATLGALVANHRPLGRVRVVRLAEPEPGDLVWVLSGEACGALLTFLGRPAGGLMGARVLRDGMEAWVPSVALYRRGQEDGGAMRARMQRIAGVAS